LLCFCNSKLRSKRLFNYLKTTRQGRHVNKGNCFGIAGFAFIAFELQPGNSSVANVKLILIEDFKIIRISPALPVCRYSIHKQHEE